LKRRYLFYYEQVIKGQWVVDLISHQVGDELEVAIRQQLADEKSHQVGGQLEMPEIFGRIPWKHHVHIIFKCQTLDEALFYHIPQHRYVVIELKVVKYIPEFAGKLNFYVTAVDELLRGEADNPTVGLIICKSTDKTVVEWSLRDINKPLGVSSYQLEEVVERTVKELEMKKEKCSQKHNRIGIFVYFCIYNQHKWLLK
jgi:hypothetical protein